MATGQRAGDWRHRIDRHCRPAAVADSRNPHHRCPDHAFRFRESVPRKVVARGACAGPWSQKRRGRFGQSCLGDGDWGGKCFQWWSRCDRRRRLLRKGIAHQNSSPFIACPPRRLTISSRPTDWFACLIETARCQGVAADPPESRVRQSVAEQRCCNYMTSEDRFNLALFLVSTLRRAW